MKTTLKAQKPYNFDLSCMVFLMVIIKFVNTKK